MTANKKSRPVYCNTLNGKKQSMTKSSNCILSLTRAAVKLALTADLVLLLATLGSLNIPVTILALLALNPLCGKLLEATR